MLKEKFMAILRCPACVTQPHQPEQDPGLLDAVADGQWLVCRDCGRKYPVQQDIPVMLIEVGTSWQATAVEALPVPPLPLKA